MVANLVIAIAKGVAGLVSGAAAMLAEAAHSVADTTNRTKPDGTTRPAFDALSTARSGGALP